jgi:hypothetical protein
MQVLCIILWPHIPVLVLTILKALTHLNPTPRLEMPCIRAGKTKSSPQENCFGSDQVDTALFFCSCFCMYQILDMNNSELGHLARHLGHDPKTHQEYYRLSHSTIQLSTVHKLNV